jgi:hypothetical protein
LPRTPSYPAARRKDLHWVDDSTVDLISALARRRSPAKLMLLATCRPLDLK